MLAMEVFLPQLCPLNYSGPSICVATELYAKSILHYFICGGIWLSYSSSYFFHLDMFNYIFNSWLFLYCVFPTLMDLLWLWYAASVIELLFLGIPEEPLKKQEDT